MRTIQLVLALLAFESLLWANPLEDCYTDVFRQCDSVEDSDSCVAEGLELCRQNPNRQPSPEISCPALCKELAALEKKYKRAVKDENLDAMDLYFSQTRGLKENAKQCGCPKESSSSSKPKTRFYNLASNNAVELKPSCKKFEGPLKTKIQKALQRFEECLQYAYIQEELAEALVLAVQKEGISIECQAPQNVRHCAAGGHGFGYMEIDPRVLTGKRVCPDVEDMIIHEFAHTAGLAVSYSHDTEGETDEPDQVYSIAKLCMTKANQWLKRKKASDVVEADKVKCVKRCMEQTVETGVDPFWLPMKQAIIVGRDPCE